MSQPHPEYEQVRLCTVIGAIHARLLQEALASQGIPSRAQLGVSFDTVLGTAHVPPPPIGGSESTPVAIWVNKPDFDRAYQVYQDFEEQDIQTEAEEDEPPE